jgi:hypothetical protein
VSKKIAHRSALVLSLLVLTTAFGRMYAQSSAPTPPAPSTVTGGDPEPIGEDVFWILLPIIATAGVS